MNDYTKEACCANEAVAINREPSMLETLHTLVETQDKTIAELHEILTVFFGKTNMPEIGESYNCFAEELAGAKRKAAMILSAVSSIRENLGA